MLAAEDIAASGKLIGSRLAHLQMCTHVRRVRQCVCNHIGVFVCALSVCWSCRAVILMESNLGMTELEELITRLGDRSKVRGSRRVCEQWHSGHCCSTHSRICAPEVLTRVADLATNLMCSL